MKLLSLICAFVVIIQIIIPCGDNGLSMQQYNRQKEVSSNHSQDSAHKDSCTPFCQCACCATPTIQQLSYSIIFPYPIHLNSPTAYLPGKILKVSLNIWQPPQLLA